MRALIVAAGTGGHITPGISIANKIKREQPDSKILFVGTKNGMENDIISKEGYDIKHVRAQGIRREITIDNIKRVFNLWLGIKDAKRIINEFKPDVVIGTGGYVCYSIFKVATKKHIPTLLHESNSIPGKVVKVMAKKVNTIMVGFEQTKDKIKNAKNIVYTGTPTKLSTYIPMENIKKILELNEELPVILVTGGSQGAQKINEIMIDIIANESNRKYQLVFVTGQKQYDVIINKLKEKNVDINKLCNIKILPYVYNMEQYLQASSLVVSRAGALSLTEVCYMGKPSILIPYPYAAENHQVYNAKVLEEVGAAKVILENELNYEKLNDMINSLINASELLKNMSNKAFGLSLRNVDDKIYNEICKVLR